jgi:hypothetical protein
MKIWQKALISTLVTLSVGGVYLCTVWRHRQDPGVIGRNSARSTASPDDAAVVRTLSPRSFEDTLALEGKSVWMKNGNTMAYFPYEDGHAAFSHRVGVIPPLQRLDIKKIVKSSVPRDFDDGMSGGGRQAFAIFALPGRASLYATPIGVIQGSEEAYFCDVLFFYDDPHTIYDFWPKDVWAAIDAHQVKPGMSELETRLALGRDMHADSTSEGNRTVTYNHANKKWTITFVDDHATKIEAG